MNKKGGLDAIETLGVVVLILMVIGGVIIWALKPTQEGAKTISDAGTCSAMASFLNGIGGRCFPDEACGNKPGWKATPITAGCSDKRPVCCYLDKPEEYYVPGTILLTVTGTPKATFTLKQNGPVLEYGEVGVAKKYFVGETPVIPMTAPFILKLFTGDAAEYHECHAKIKAGESFPLPPAEQTEKNLFLSLTPKEALTWKALRKEGGLSCERESVSGGEDVCKATLTVTCKKDGGAGDSQSLASFPIFFRRR